MDITQQIEKATQCGNTVRTSGPVTEQQLEQLEAALGFALPASYRSFVKQWGSIAINEDTLSGISDPDPLALLPGNLYGATLALRQELAGECDVPKNLWVINAHEDGAFCFNSEHKTASGELAIINFEPYLPAESFTEALAEDFEEFLQRWFFAAYVDDE